MASAPFLTHLGISEIQQARPPVASAFPLAFNVNARSIWEQIIETQQNTRGAQKDALTAWAEAVREFIRICEAQDQFPFQRTAVDQTSKSSQFLGRARAALTEFMERSPVFNLVPRLTDVDHQAQMRTDGFRISMSGRAVIKDPTFGQFLADSGFATGLIPNRCGRTVHHGLSFWFEPESNGTHWKLGYDLDCPEFPEHPSTELPSAAALERFIMSVLWTPLMRAHRTNRYGRRLI